jgi:hypothetical protein
MNRLTLKTSVLLIAALTGGTALAQPTPAQTDAIKSNCRSDYMKSCMSVPTGGQAAFDCLKRNMPSLSPACQQAVNAVSPPTTPKPAAAAPAPAPAAPAPTPAAVTAPQPPAPAPTVAATPAPVAAPAPVATAPAAKPAAAPKPAPAPKPAVVAATPPTAAQQNAIRQSCRNDFMANCSGVQPGGKEALVCLQTNASKLSPACRTAVSAIGGAAKPAATAAATPAAPAAAVEAAPVMPTKEQQAAIKNTCRADFMRNCRGVQPGGPEALMCLQANSARLSPNCKTSVAAIADSLPPASAAAATASAATTATPAPAAKRQYLTPGIHPAVRVGRRIRERIEENR